MKTSNQHGLKMPYGSHKPVNKGRLLFLSFQLGERKVELSWGTWAVKGTEKEGHCASCSMGRVEPVDCSTEPSSDGEEARAKHQHQKGSKQAQEASLL